MAMSEAKEVLKILLFGVLPPDNPDDWNDPEQLAMYRKLTKRWRKALAAAVWAQMLVILTIVLFLAGLVPPQWNRPAWSQDLKPLSDQIVQMATLAKDTRKSQLRTELREARRFHCKAIHDRNNQGIETYGGILEQLKDEFKALTGDEWRNIPCAEMEQ
jgi:hypothetical protein